MRTHPRPALPLQPRGKVSGLGADETIVTSTGNLAIVVADDSEGERYLLQRALDDIGLGVADFVENGLELLDYLSGHIAKPQRPLLVLLDLNMPMMDGREALRAIREQSHFRHIPVVVLTNSSNQLDIDEAYRIGANSFFTKPLTYDGLVELVRVLKRYWVESAALPRTH
jgi:two-component system response regulator